MIIEEGIKADAGQLIWVGLSPRDLNKERLGLTRLTYLERASNTSTLYNNYYNITGADQERGEMGG